MSESLKAMKLALEAFDSVCAVDRADAMKALRVAIDLETKYEKWVGLTLEEIDEAIAGNITITNPNLRDGVYGAIVDLELLLKDKNTHET